MTASLRGRLLLEHAEELLVTSMKKYRITKIVTAKDFISALKKESTIQPVEITQLQEEEARKTKERADAIGFHISTDEEDDDSDGGE